jgi:nitroimidazol reductase NimA-like FMN-containing flavoprotein (pyridoxamine 5'-phosphate oxidase superfamily)
MREDLPRDAEDVLERGDLCYVATATRHGPHVTPMVFAVSDGRVWLTTSRGSVKARAWRIDASVGGLVRTGDVAVAFTGEVRTFDLLDVGSWLRDLFEAPALAAASARFSRKNARFFAGYAVDARHVPLSWTPPGRVFTAIELERVALLGPAGVAEAFGAWDRAVPSVERFRASRTGPDPLEGVPEEVRDALGERGQGALALQAPTGVVVLPVSWVVSGAGLYAALAREDLALAGLRDPRPLAALAIDRASWWRARNMTGVMVRGRAEIAAPGGLTSGGGSLARLVAAAGAPEDAALVRLRAGRLVWWQGWTSGTVEVA